MTPRTLPEVDGVPRTGAEILAQVERVHHESVAYWADYPTREFFEPPAPGVWSAADQVRHLTRALRAITQGLRTPRLVLRVLFGRPKRASRALPVLRADYRAALAAGGQAGRFAPRPVAADERDERARARVFAAHAGAIMAFGDALRRWREDALDAYALPHPLLGKLTAREMALFALYHDVHHVHVAERRRREGGQRAPGRGEFPDRVS